MSRGPLAQRSRPCALPWDDGEPDGQQIQSLTATADWKFYSTAREMNKQYHDEHCPRGRGYSFKAAEAAEQAAE